MKELSPVSAVPCGVYRHFKGKLYRVLGVARHSETLEEMVVYQALYGERGFWVRPLVMFQEQVQHEGRVLPRFAPAPEAEEESSS